MHTTKGSLSDMKELNLNDLDGVSGGVGGGGTIPGGTFASNTGTGLNIRVDCEIKQDGLGTKTLLVTVSTWSYALYSVALQNGVELRVNGALYTADSNAVSYSGKTLDKNVLATFSVPNLSGTVTLTAIWHFRGTYSNVTLNEISASGTITV